MSEGTKKSYPFNKIAFAALLSIGLGFGTGQSINVVKKNKENVKLTKQLVSVKSELTKSKARIEGIKGQDDLFTRDIELYVRGRYRKVPKVVAQKIASTVVDLSKKEEMSPELIMGIIQVESQFNPMAVGPKTKYGNARGLMQVMPAWAKKFELSSIYDLHDVDINIISGIKIFKFHLEEAKGSISKGLFFYVNQDKSYVDKVYNAMGRFVSFRSTIDDNEKNEESEQVNEEVKKVEPVKEEVKKVEPVKKVEKKK
jgi:hypothetical protein